MRLHLRRRTRARQDPRAEPKLASAGDEWLLARVQEVETSEGQTRRSPRRRITLMLARSPMRVQKEGSLLHSCDGR